MIDMIEAQLILAIFGLGLAVLVLSIFLRIEYDKRKRIERVLADLHGRIETTQLTMMDLLIEVRMGRKQS